MELEDSVLSEISQTEKNKSIKYSHMWELKEQPNFNTDW